MENTVENNKIIELINQIDADSQITNELIAEFMGWSIQKDPTERFFGHYFTPERIKHEKLFFDSDWNWLMEVVNKISALYNRFMYKADEGQHYCEIWCYDGNEVAKEIEIFGDTAIEAHYIAVIEFIKWYNATN